ncbi:AMP-binding protein [Roseovarius amoyensis]|uniref:AMP-binding protein n=1 Tax=Roseovarius amoyensis TaxID=2211448 RepID=UPI000DBE13F4|nr:AMP-binding protein [Roseovarius amoyensis]
MIFLPNGTEPEWTTIDELIRDQARRSPDALAVEVGGCALTYAQLDSLSDSVAVHLSKAGIGRGVRVGTMLYNSIEQILIFIATVKLGGVWVPLNVSLRGEDLGHAITDSDPTLFVCEDETLPHVRDAIAITKSGCQVAVLGHESGDALFSETDARPATVENSAGDPSMIIYTGGTTGLPKGVLLPHFAVVAAGYRYVEAFEIRPQDRHYSVLQLFHVGGLFIGLMGPLVAGIPTHFERWFSASRFWPRVAEVGATVIDPIGTMVSVLCSTPETPADADNTVRVSLGALSQVPKRYAESFPRRFGLGVVNVYSLTESGGVLIINNRPGSDEPLANGLTHGWCEISIRGKDDTPVSDGDIGEICLRPTVPHTFMMEYLNRPDATVECWRNFWLHTGDLGYVSPKGFLYLTGRQAHWLRVRGENVSAYEVEDVLSGYPGIAEVVVIGVPSELGEEDPKAFIIPEEGAEVDPEALTQWAQQRMASFKVPRYIQFVTDFPRSSTKREVARHMLRDLPNDNMWDANTVFGRGRSRATGQSGGDI